VKILREERESSACILKVDISTQFIFITISFLCELLWICNNFFRANGEERNIAIKKLPIEEVYTAHSPKVFVLKEIPPVYLM